MKKIFSVLALLIVGLSVWAQDPEPVKPNPIERDPDIVNITEDNTPYHWRGEDYFVSGTYRDTLHVEDNTIPDTIFSLVLRVKLYDRKPMESVLIYPTQTIYSWRKKDWPVVDGAIYQDTVQVPDWLDADTIYSLKMTLKQFYLMATHHANVCVTTLPYQWRGRDYNTDGIYHDTVRTALLKDTVYTLKLTTGKPSEQFFSFRICQGEKVEFQGKTYTKEGIDTIYLKSSFGCDSIYVVDVRVGKKTLITTENQICEGDTYTWYKQSTGRDTILTQSGYYYDSLVSTASGCDSILCLHLTVNRPKYINENKRICEHELPYLWHGYSFNQTGVYYDTIRRSSPCDSIACLTLTVLKDSLEQRNITFCSKFGTRHNGGEVFYNDTMFIDTLITPGEGCYRIVTTTYQAGEGYFYSEDVHRAEGVASIQWHGQTFTDDGVHTIQKPGDIGCDSIWQLHLMTDYYRHQEIYFCEGDTLYHHELPISKDTLVTDSFKTKFGGDSVILLNYKHNPQYIYKTDTFRMCSNEPMPWPGHEHIVFLGEGIYYDPYQTQAGCDSIYTAFVKAGKPSRKDTLIHVCRYHEADSLPYIWYDHNGQFYSLNETQEIVEELGTTSSGCDSIFTLIFQVAEKWSLDTAYLCPDGSVTIDGHRYTAVGDYEHWLISPGSNYKDSVHYIHIKPAKISYDEIWEEKTICKNETPYRWHSRMCDKSGEYKDTILSSCNCDSIVYLRLTVNPSYSIPYPIDICQGDTFIYGNKGYTGGIYYDTLKTIACGCDSVIKLIVNERPRYLFASTVYFQAGSTYKWTGHHQDTILTKEGTYWDSCYTTTYGCDSIYKLELLEKKTYKFLEDTTICSNNLPYRWHKQVLYTSGDYYDSLRTTQGVDSIYHLTLHVAEVKFTSVTRNSCVGDTITIGDLKIFATCTLYDTLTTLTGCDSIVEYIFNFQPTFFQTDVIHMRAAASITWHGTTYNEPGIYYDSHTSIGGCDSTYRLMLIGDPIYIKHDSVTTCSNQPYLWHGVEYKETGIYSHKEKSQFDMDSIEYLHLFVNPVKRDTTMVSKCHGQTYYFNGKPITTSGYYSDTLFSYQGCDSISTAIANFYPTYFFSDTVHLVNGQSLPWQDTTITSTGIYQKRYPTTNCDCDSTYELVVMLADTFKFTESMVVCQSELPYQWHGQTIVTSGIYQDKHTTQYGADSIHYLNLRVAATYCDTSYTSICSGGRIHFFSQTITQPGIYSDTLLTVDGCDSIFVLHVNQADQKINYDTLRGCFGQSIPVLDTIFTTSGEYEYITKTDDGCDSILHFTIQIEPKFYFSETKTINEGTSYIWKGHKGDIELSIPNIYWDSLTTVNGCDSIYCLTLSINRSYLFEESATICKNETPYSWHGQLLTETGIYYDRQKTIVGLDSIYSIDLTINDAIYTTIEINACPGEVVILGLDTFKSSKVHYDTIYTKDCPQITSYNINFRPKFNKTQTYQLSVGELYTFYEYTISKPGTYVHNEPTIYGCDSTITLIVSAAPQPTPTQVHYSMCSGDSITIGDTTIYKGCSFTRTYVSSFGIDSVVQYNIHENPSYNFVKKDVICENGTYQWKGHFNDTILDKPGYYRDSFPTINGCDSIYTLILTSVSVFISDTTIYRCLDELPFIFRGKEYAIDTTFVDTFHTATRCDSICITRFFISEHCSPMELITKCDNELITIDNHIITRDGEYRYLIPEDSIHRFNVFSYPTYEFTTILSDACDSVRYGDTIFIARKDNDTIRHRFMWQTIHGCDSIEHLQVALNRSSFNDTIRIEIPDYAYVLFDGQRLDHTGIYTHQHWNAHGCDSTERVKLTIYETTSPGVLQVYYCNNRGEDIEIFKKRYHPTKDTTILDTIRYKGDDIMAIQTAFVHVTTPFTITSLELPKEICSDVERIHFYLHYTHTGSYPATYSLKFLPNQLVASPNPQEGLVDYKDYIEVVLDGGGRYVRPGNYPFELNFKTENCPPDTTILGTITVNYPSTLLESYWDNTVVIKNKDFNGGWDLLPPYNWHITNASGFDKTALINPNHNQSYFCSSSLEAGDIITISPLRDGYKTAIPSCSYTFYPAAIGHDVPVLVLPTTVAKRGRVQIKASSQGSYDLFTSTGQLCQKGEVFNGVSDVEMPGVTGCYLIHITLTDGTTKTERILVY